MLYIIMSKLLGQGGFGCVYYPKLTCDGKSTKNYKYVSKLQTLSPEVYRELKIGKKIANIPYYNLHFGVITSSCKVDLGQFKKNSILKECEVVNKNPDEEYILSKIEYIPGEEMKDYLINLNDESTYLFITLNSYYFLMNSLQILDANKVCHYDIKFENIIYNFNDKIPIIIDFGLSWNYNEVENFIDLKDLRQYFYTYAPEYYIWCPEIQIISLLVNHSKNENTLNQKILTMIINQVVEGMGIWENFTEQFKEETIKSMYQYYERFLDKENKYVINELLKFKSTWDSYSLGISFLRQYIRRIKKVQNSKIIALMNVMIQLFLYNISPNPEKRPQINQIKEVLYNSFIKDFKEKNITTYFEYEFQPSNYQFYKNEIIPYLNFFHN